jgi:hypothetical protein
MYASLYQLIQPHIEKSCAELPADVQERVDKEFFPHSWDSLAPSQRSSLAEQYDTQRDPAMAEENQYWFDLQCEIDEGERQIAEWEAMGHQGIPSEARIKDDKLSTLRLALASLNRRWEQPFLSKTSPATKQGVAQPSLPARSSLPPETPKGPRAYTSLHELVQPYLNHSYDELPEEIASRVAADFYPHSWQRSTPAERFSLSLDRDKELDPALSEHAYWFALQSQIVEIEHRIENIESRSDQPIVDDGKPIEETLRSLRSEMGRLHAKWHRPSLVNGSAQQVELEKNRRDPNPGLVEMPDALQFLAQNTGTPWTDTQLFSFASKCHIGLHAVVPPWTPVDIIRHNADGFFSRHYIEPGRILMAELGYGLVEALWIMGTAEATTACYAPPPNSGDLICFTEPVRVNRCHVRLTKERLLRILKEWESLQRLVATAPPATPLNPVASTGATPNNWDEHSLRRLLSESREPGMTQQKLAGRYNVTRQRIGALLKEASPKKTDPFSALKSRAHNK